MYVVVVTQYLIDKKIKCQRKKINFCIESKKAAKKMCVMLRSNDGLFIFMLELRVEIRTMCVRFVECVVSKCYYK